MASTIRFSDDSKWVGNNWLFWTVIEYLSKHKERVPDNCQELEHPVVTGIKFCDFRGFKTPALLVIRQLIVKLRDEDLASEWQYTSPPSDFVPVINDILGLVDKRLDELSEDEDNAAQQSE